MTFNERDLVDEDELLPWKTVRDALRGLPKPRPGSCAAFPDHILIPGARRYAGHTGSSLDWPSKTVKAGVHGVPGGENTVVLDNGSVRYFTLREAARLQTFPDSYSFIGSRTTSMRQIGNAVPCVLAQAVAEEVRRELVHNAGGHT